MTETFNEDFLAKILAYALSAHTHHPGFMTAEMATRLAFFYAQDHNERLDPAHLTEAVRRICTQANKTLDLGPYGYSLSVGELRRKTQGLPDNMPVLLERHAHPSAQQYLIAWDRDVIPHEEWASLPAEQKTRMRVISENGKPVVYSLLTFETAFGAYVSEGALCVHSSY